MLEIISISKRKRKQKESHFFLWMGLEEMLEIISSSRY
jgi:hypothetical protein